MRSLAKLVTAFVITLAPLASARAQASQSGTLKVVVVTADSGAPIASASVRLDRAAAEGSTDSAGVFIFRNVGVGDYRITARRLGFVPGSMNARVNGDATTSVLLRLAPAPRELPEVEVRGRRVIDLPRFTQAVERASRNNGAVFTADQIAKENPFDTKALLEQLPGVHVTDRGITFVRCQDSGVIRKDGVLSSGGAFVADPDAGLGGQKVLPARVQVYVDGVRLTNDEAVGQGAFDPNDANGILSRINPRSIAVMEVYTGIARIPAEYVADACAVVAIWTKAY